MDSEKAGSERDGISFIERNLSFGRKREQFILADHLSG
jgi:hypothetical protein